MQRMVMFRPDQKITDDDLNNLGIFARASLDALVSNAVTSLRYFTGFTAIKTGATEVTLSAGHYWGGGPVFQRSEPTVFNMLTGGTYMPVVTRRKVAIVAWGETIDTDVQERSFVIDDQGNTEPQSVAMESLRYARLGLVAGVEGPSPQNPTLDGTVIPIAFVLLDTSGVVSIEPAEDYRLPSVESLNQLVAAIEAWRADVGQTLNTILSELARIQAAIPPDFSDAIAAILRRLEELENLVRRPQAAIKTFVDRFITEADSDLDAAGYSCRIDNGLRFPADEPTRGPLELNNPTDPKVKIVNNILMPAWSAEKPRITISGADGELSISQYTSQTTERVQKTASRTITQYSGWWTINTNEGIGTLTPSSVTLKSSDGFVKLTGEELDAFIERARYANSINQRVFQFKRDSGEAYDFIIRNYTGAIGLTQFSFAQATKRVVNETYWDVVTRDATVTGSQIAQTFLNATNGWLTSIEISCGQVAASGDLKVYVTEAVGGKPLKDRVISRGTIPVASLVSQGDVRCAIEPVYLKGGRTYAVILVSTGNHFIKVASGNKYVSGHAFYLSDTGEWVQVQNSGDVCMALNFAYFDQSRIEVLLNPLSHASGIDEIKIVAAQIEPEGTSLTFEIQRAGKWYQLSEGEFDALDGSPTMVNLRMVFSGTRDLMPGIDMSQTEYELGATLDEFTHFSKSHVLDATYDDAQVIYYVRGWDSARHNLDCDLIVPGPSTKAPASTVIEPDPEDSQSVRITFTFDNLSAAPSYVVKTVGETDTATRPFVVTQRFDSPLSA